MSHRGKTKPGMPAFDFITLGKRDGAGASGSAGASGNAPKKLKSGTSSKPVESGAGWSSKQGGSLWESFANESVAPEHLAASIMECHANEDHEAVVALMCGAVKSLKSQRAKPDSTLYLTLIFLLKAQPEICDYVTNSDYVLEAFCSLLKRDPKESYKAKGNR